MNTWNNPPAEGHPAEQPKTSQPGIAEHRVEDGWKLWYGGRARVAELRGLALHDLTEDAHVHLDRSRLAYHSHPLGAIKHDHAPGDETAISTHIPARTGSPAGNQVTSQRDWALTDRVAVNRTDLEYLLAHYWDEVRGDPPPDRTHWQLSMLEQACLRLSAALKEPS